MNRMYLLACSAMLAATAARGQFEVGLDGLYGRLDTGPSHKVIGSPLVGIDYRFGPDARHAIGAGYSRFEWHDDLVYTFSVPPNAADMIYRSDIRGDAQWDIGLVRYTYTAPLTRRCSWKAGVAAGPAYAREVSRITSFGGISGIMTTRHAPGSSARLATQATLLLETRMSRRIGVVAGISYLRINAPTRTHFVMGALSGVQATAGLRIEL